MKSNFCREWPESLNRKHPGLPSSLFGNWLVPGVLAMTAAATAALMVFIKVADEMLEGDTHTVDTAIILWLRNADNPADPVGPRWLEDFVRDITALGSPAVLGLFVLITVVFLFLADQKRLSLFMLAATTGGTLVAALLKTGFDRPRPNLSLDGVYVYTASFPSGHAMVSALVYLTLGAMIARLTPRVRLKLYVLTVSFMLTALVGFSRIYLGVHWPSDVLAGWAAGAAWALGGGAIAPFMTLDKEGMR
ncbi:MAG: phosphatase PAP2 family protein [Gammaproteobacteria bacterium]